MQAGHATGGGWLLALGAAGDQDTAVAPMGCAPSICMGIAHGHCTAVGGLKPMLLRPMMLHGHTKQGSTGPAGPAGLSRAQRAQHCIAARAAHPPKQTASSSGTPVSCAQQGSPQAFSHLLRNSWQGWYVSTDRAATTLIKISAKPNLRTFSANQLPSGWYVSTDRLPSLEAAASASPSSYGAQQMELTLALCSGDTCT